MYLQKLDFHLICSLTHMWGLLIPYGKNTDSLSQSLHNVLKTPFGSFFENLKFTSFTLPGAPLCVQFPGSFMKKCWTASSSASQGGQAMQEEQKHRVTGVPLGSSGGWSHTSGPQVLADSAGGGGGRMCVFGSPLSETTVLHFSRDVSRVRLTITHHIPGAILKQSSLNFYHFNSILILMVHTHLHPHYHWHYSHLTYEAWEDEKSKYFPKVTQLVHEIKTWTQTLFPRLPPTTFAGAWCGLESLHPFLRVSHGAVVLGKFPGATYTWGFRNCWILGPQAEDVYEKSLPSDNPGLIPKELKTGVQTEMHMWMFTALLQWPEGCNNPSITLPVGWMINKWWSVHNGMSKGVKFWHMDEPWNMPREKTQT